MNCYEKYEDLFTNNHYNYNLYCHACRFTKHMQKFTMLYNKYWFVQTSPKNYRQKLADKNVYTIMKKL